jgi:hypothetical protein
MRDDPSSLDPPTHQAMNKEAAQKLEEMTDRISDLRRYL